MSETSFPENAWRRRARPVAAAALCVVLAAGGVRAETLRAHYSLSLMGLPIGNAYANGSLEPRAYRIEIGMRTTGLANLVNNTKGAASASGNMTPGGPSPASYANTTSNSEETRTVRMALTANTVRSVEVRPAPWDMDARVPVDEEARRHILDPVSALIMSVPAGEAMTGPAACNRTIPVFDGVTRFNVTLYYAGEQSIDARGYAGPVAVCTARYMPIAGHRPDSPSTRYMTNNRDMTVWLAPLPEAHVVVPIYMDIGTAAGKLIIEAAEFQIGQRRAQSTQ